MSAPPLIDDGDYETSDDELEQVGAELIKNVPHSKSPVICPTVELGRAQEIQELKKLASNKISDQISLIVDRFERERYLLLQKYQDRLAVIHDREKAALKDFVSGITFNSSRQTRTDMIDKISSYYLKIRNLTNF